MNKSYHSDSQKQTIIDLQRRIHASERSHLHQNSETFSTGCESLDRLLPGRGIQQGSLVEWLGHGHASGAGIVSLIIGRQICPAERRIVLIDTRRELFPLSLTLLGFDLSQLILIRPNSEQEALWACEEALRCQAIGLVWATMERLHSISFRRLQLAAETSAAIGFLVRSTKVLHQPSWARVRLQTGPRSSCSDSPCFRVEVVACHGTFNHATADIRIDHLRGTIHGRADSSHSLSVVS